MDEELEFDPSIVVCEECGGIVKYQGSGAYVCIDCGHKVFDDYGKVKDFLEKRGPSNIMEISYATGLERNVVAKLLMDGRIQVARKSIDGKVCMNCGMPINHGKYCNDCAGLVAERKRKKAVSEKNKSDKSKIHFMGGDPKKPKSKQK